MPLLKANLYFTLKIFLAIIIISIIVGLASADMAPDVPIASVLIVCAIAAAIFFVALILCIIGGASFNQEIIRSGGTDASWFWFNAEPPGLEKLRAELKETKE
jgi:hypothetical protein